MAKSFLDYGGRGFRLDLDNKPYSYAKRKKDLEFLEKELFRRGIAKNRLRIKPSRIPRGLGIAPIVG